MRLSARASAAVATASLIATIVGIGTASASPPGKAALAGSVPAWATSANFKEAADTTANVGFRVYLGWTDEQGAAAIAQAVSDPHSPSYGHYLTPAQFRHQFAPSQASVNAVTSWLRSQGFAIDYTPQNNRYVAAEGTLSQAAAAFGTSFGLYAYQGDMLLSPASALTVPASLSGIVEGVAGLDDSAALVQTDHVIDGNAPPSPGFRNSPPLSAWWAQQSSPYAYPAGFTAVSSPSMASWTVAGYTPAQIKGAYGISGFDGSGQTVAIVDAYASPTIAADVNQWSVNRGLPTMNPAQFKQVVAPGTYIRPQVVNHRKIVQNPQGWYGEETLDIEAVHGMAPAANIVFVGAPNNYRDLDAALNHVVDQHLAQIVSNSYGFNTEDLPTGFIKPVEDTLVQAAAEGIGVYFSSGDGGDETSVVGSPTPDWPASSPWVTAVGGTSIGIDASNARALETGWGTSSYSCNKITLVCVRTGWLYGAGGGVSRLFAEPSWQLSAGTFSGRAVPDVAALADPQTGLLIGQTQTFPGGPSYDEYRIGGTSVASPIFAGLMALADQKAGSPHGFANPLFYANASSFNDILSVKTAVARRNFVNSVDGSAGTVDRLRTFDDYSGSPTQHTGPGWDNVTGLGSPNGIFSH
jgi:subtilase family serine protease